MSFIKIKDPRKREELIKDLIETGKRIKDNFIARKVGEAEYQTGLTKLFKPVIETQKATAKEITEAQKTTAERIEKGLLPIREALENPLILPPIETEDPIPTIKSTKEDITNIGELPLKYLLPVIGKQKTNSDIKPGDPKISLFFIGKTPVKIEDNDIIIKDKTYIGTPGLWKLLTSRDIPDKTEYKKNDLARYIKIMSLTNTTRQGFNRDYKGVGGGNDKMNKLIKPFVKTFEEKGNDSLLNKIEDHFKNTDEEDEDTDEEDEDPKPGTSGTEPTYKPSGTGLKILPSDPNALIDRFDLLFSSQKAGHTGVKNEIVAILDELKRQKVINVQDYKKLNSLIKK